MHRSVKREQLRRVRRGAGTSAEQVSQFLHKSELFVAITRRRGFSVLYQVGGAKGERIDSPPVAAFRLVGVFDRMLRKRSFRKQVGLFVLPREMVVA